jgi:transcriptional regulator with XRE-family HTH domain
MSGIGQIIKQKREAQQLTQTELAKKAQVVTQAMISRIEAGDENAKIDTLRGIAAALGCSVVDILPPEDKKWRSSRIQADA